jgi:hypothetical protein
MKPIGPLILVLATLTSPAHATQCAGTHAETRVLSPPATSLPPDGGIVVGTASVAGLAHDAKAPTWSARVDGHAVMPTTLAPGLVVYRVLAAASHLEVLEVLEGSSVRARATRSETYGKALAAPVATAIVDAAFPEAVGTTTTVTLSSPVPVGAIAVVLYDHKGRARAWAAVLAGATEIVIYDDRLCATLPTGTIEPSSGDRVELAWIDAAGRPSAHSTTVIVSR